LICTEEEMVNEVAQREDEEMEAMLSMMENTTTSLNSPMEIEMSNPITPTSYNSDDEEYDNLFMSALQELETRQSKSLFQIPNEGGDDRMDES